MSKTQTIFVCDNCGAETTKWGGKCYSCGAWNSFKEMRGMKIGSEATGSQKNVIPKKLNKISLKSQDRIKTGIFEFDRVVGGGIVKGSVVLLGGAPGIGKSTLILEIAEGVKDTLYISGEESIYQLKLRAERIGLKGNFLIIDDINIEQIIATAKEKKPDLLIVDSIQTMHDPLSETSPGSLTQVKSVGLKLQQLAKTSGIAVIIIGHITKSGAVAGPKTLEHLVDTVLYFEGDKYHGQRILRTTKNRFGSTFESGVFEMTARGLKEIKNPSAIFINNEISKAAGSVTTISMEGTRPFIFEVQALCPHSSFGYAKRTASGLDLSRVQLISAVVTEHTRVNLQNRDIYVNLVGGVKVREPAIDLAIATAMMSAARKKPTPNGSLFIGEIGLTGEIRDIPQIEKRLIEASRQGYKKLYIPRTRKNYKAKNLRIYQLANLKELERTIFGH